MTGFLVPAAAHRDARSDEEEDEDLGNTVFDEAGLQEESAEDGRASRRAFFPSSMGLSFLVPGECRELTVTVRWGDYERVSRKSENDGDNDVKPKVWRRIPRESTVTIAGVAKRDGPEVSVPESDGLKLHWVERRLSDDSFRSGPPAGTRAMSVFLVNRRTVGEDARLDAGYAFQAEIEIRCAAGFVGHPDPRGARSRGWDAEVADLHYTDAPAYATGHGVSVDWETVEGVCRVVRTAWIAGAEVERTETQEVPGVELSMEVLGEAADGATMGRMLRPLVTEYRAWIDQRRSEISVLDEAHRQTAGELLRRAEMAASRIERGISVLEADDDALDAFRMANKAVAKALAKRIDEQHPRWRAFQLAFVLLNLRGLANPTDPEREIADLLFFPTGGGKTEAYLGLAAFAMVLRRLRNPGEAGHAGAGVSVIMRYTLRLLTFDQLSRAAGLVCALELLRRENTERYGEWRFEIGLWVGKAATPNSMGKAGDKNQHTALARVNKFKQNPNRWPSPIPLQNCPWCSEPFHRNSFSLEPDSHQPTDLRVHCVGSKCEFDAKQPLPIVAVDEPLYRRLPAFLIATVDKFASLPWVGPSGALLGGADRYDASGFYGAAEPGRGMGLPNPLPPPDLVVQDELHLISGPLGTMAGLYETAVDALCTRDADGQDIRPKIVASTATASRADEQVQAIFGRATTHAFPPAGPDRRDSFFARTRPESAVPARRYLGIAAPGRNPKFVMRRVLVSLMAVAQRAFWCAGGEKNTSNPADPYMTTLAYFNALRELGGGRRIIEEEVQGALTRYGVRRRRIGETAPLFRNRRLSEVMELTSRVSTDRVARARERLDLPFWERKSKFGRVDCAIATNMISVGLDIQRLGLMVVVGQPKTNAEYIQATSRIGRDAQRPGLVVTLLNIYKPRDRSHYERFRHSHETFYRAVEPASVTPFSARALDRGIAGAVVALARHSISEMTPSVGAASVGEHRQELERRLLDAFVNRAKEQPNEDDDEFRELQSSVRRRVDGLLDAWRRICQDNAQAAVALHYQQREAKAHQWLLRNVLESEPDVRKGQFRAGRSLRDVEPEVRLSVQDLIS